MISLDVELMISDLVIEDLRLQRLTVADSGSACLSVDCITDGLTCSENLAIDAIRNGLHK